MASVLYITLPTGCGTDSAPLEGGDTETDEPASTCSADDSCPEDSDAVESDTADSDADNPECTFAEECVAGMSCREGVCVDLEIIEPCDRVAFGSPQVWAESLGDVRVLTLLNADADDALELLVLMPNDSLQILDDAGAEPTRVEIAVDPRFRFEEYLPIDLDGDGDDELLMREPKYANADDVYIYEAIGDGQYELRLNLTADGSHFQVGDLQGDGGVDIAGPFFDGVQLLQGNGTTVSLASDHLFEGSHGAVTIGRLNEDTFDDLVTFGDGAVSVHFGGSAFPSNAEILTQGTIGRRTLVTGDLGPEAQLLSLTERDDDYLVEVWPVRPNAGAWSSRRWSLPVETTRAYSSGALVRFGADQDPGVWLSNDNVATGLLLDVGRPTMCLQPPPPELLTSVIGDIDRDGTDEWITANAGTIWIHPPT